MKKRLIASVGASLAAVLFFVSAAFAANLQYWDGLTVYGADKYSSKGMVYGGTSNVVSSSLTAVIKTQQGPYLTNTAEATSRVTMVHGGRSNSYSLCEWKYPWYLSGSAHLTCHVNR